MLEIKLEFRRRLLRRIFQFISQRLDRGVRLHNDICLELQNNRATKELLDGHFGNEYVREWAEEPARFVHLFLLTLRLCFCCLGIREPSRAARKIVLQIL